ncbi:MAG: PadR family transcriptional regulator [Candidatus Krumholzibacteriales bacterium]
MANDKKTERFLRIWSREYKKGFLTYFILLLLKDTPMYGLEIANKLKHISDRSVRLHGSNIYQILKKLKLHGMVSSKMKDSIKGPSRKYYYIEEKGTELLVVFTQEYVIPLHFSFAAVLQKHYPELMTRSK